MTIMDGVPTFSSLFLGVCGTSTVNSYYNADSINRRSPVFEILTYSMTITSINMIS